MFVNGVGFPVSVLLRSFLQLSADLMQRECRMSSLYKALNVVLVKCSTFI